MLQVCSLATKVESPQSHIFETFAKYWYIIMSQLRTIVSHNFLRNFVKLFIMLNYCKKFRENSKVFKNSNKKMMLSKIDDHQIWALFFG